jgi:hypothetical protein
MSTRLPEPLSSAEYARRVRAELGELPAGVHEDLLEDLDEHLAEVAADDEGSLEAKLGPPIVYAHELRRAAGLPITTSRAPSAVERLAEVGRRGARQDAAKAVLAFLPELRPAWWVLRAWLAVAALAHLTGSRSYLLPVGRLLSIPVVAAAIVLSVRWGRAAQRRQHPLPRQRALAAGGNAALALFALVVLAAVQQQNTKTVYAGPNPPSFGYGSGGTLARQDGTPITNIYPYSSMGQPLSDVLLYDQDGRALDNLSTTRPDGSSVERLVPPGPPRPANAYPQLELGGNIQPRATGTPQEPGPALSTAPSTAPAAPGGRTTSSSSAVPAPTTPSPSTPPAATTPSPSPVG